MKIKTEDIEAKFDISLKDSIKNYYGFIETGINYQTIEINFTNGENIKMKFRLDNSYLSEILKELERIIINENNMCLVSENNKRR